MVTDTDKTVYSWFCKAADEDGYVTTHAAALAKQFHQPKRTVQGAIVRLRKTGKIETLSRGRFVVVDIADPDLHSELEGGA